MKLIEKEQFYRDIISTLPRRSWLDDYKVIKGVQRVKAFMNGYQSRAINDIMHLERIGNEIYFTGKNGRSLGICHLNSPGMDILMHYLNMSEDDDKKCCKPEKCIDFTPKTSN